ncbi:ROK family protein [Spirillospora sp. NPDC127200]
MTPPTSPSAPTLDDWIKKLRSRPGGGLSSQQQITRRNWQRVFEVIVVFRELTARNIVEATGLGHSTVFGVLKQMRQSGLIKDDPVADTGEAAGVGRRPKPIRVNDGLHYIAGVEIVREEVIGRIVDLRGEPVTPLHRLPLPRAVPDEPVDADAVVDTVRDLVDILTERLGRERRDFAGHSLVGLGVEIGGHINGATGTVVRSPNLCWGGDWTEPVRLRQRLRDATRLHTVLDNDVNALGIAQRWFGAGRGEDSFAVVFLSHDGIGGAVFCDGDLLRGATGKAGEFGHFFIDRNGPACRCKGRGCVEAVSTMAAICRTLGVDAREKAFQLAAAGDSAALRAFAHAGHTLGQAVSILLSGLDPAKIIFTGDQFTESRQAPGAWVLLNDHYHRAMLRAMGINPFSRESEHLLEMVPDAEHWNGPRGAATLVIHDVIAGAVRL